jgi:hypothetical protein
MSSIKNWNRRQDIEEEQPSGEEVHYAWENSATKDFITVESLSAREAGLDTEVYQTLVYVDFDVEGADIDRDEYEIKVHRDSKRPGYEERRFNRSQAVKELRKDVVEWMRNHPYGADKFFENWTELEEDMKWQNEVTGNVLRISEEPPGYAARLDPGENVLGSPGRVGTHTDIEGIRRIAENWMRDHPEGRR